MNKPKMKAHPHKDCIVLCGSTRSGHSATYPRGKVYDPWGIAPCILRGSSKTGSGNELQVLIEYE